MKHSSLLSPSLLNAEPHKGLYLRTTGAVLSPVRMAADKLE